MGCFDSILRHHTHNGPCVPIKIIATLEIKSDFLHNTRMVLTRGKQSFLLLTLISIVLTTVSIQDSRAVQRTILQITKIVLNSDSIQIEYKIQSPCLIGKPTLELLDKDNYLMTKLNPPKSVDTPLTALLTQDSDEKCSNKTVLNTPATITFPNELSVKNVVAFSFPVSKNGEANSNLISTTSMELRFIGITQSDSASSAREPEFQLEEFWYLPGKEPIRRVLGNKNINAILGTTKDGVIVKTFSKSNKVLTWLVTTKKWELLSDKTIYIEPGTLSKNKKWLIGRKVADGLSTRMYAQNLATGSTSIIFDVAKNGGGYVCGGMADENQVFGYFSHIAPTKTILYRIDLASRKVKALGTVKSGFCVSDVLADGRVLGLARDSQGVTNWAVLANQVTPDTASSLRTPALKGAGDGASYSFANESHIVIEDTYSASFFVTSFLKKELWEGPIKFPSYVQYLNPIPSSWQTISQRALQP